MLSVIGSLQIDRWDVAAVFVEAAVVEPVDPFGGGQFDFLDGAPGLAGFDQLSLVEAVDRLGQGIVVGAADRSHRGLDPSFGQAFRESDRLSTVQRATPMPLRFSASHTLRAPYTP